MKKLLLFAVWMYVVSATAQQNEWRYVNAEAMVYTQAPNSTNLYAGDKAGLIKRSVDNGITWEIVFEGISSNITDVAFLDANNGVATSNTNGVFITTIDGGLTWKENILTDSVGNSVNQSFYSISVINANTYILNPQYDKTRGFITKDGGVNFKELKMKGTSFHVSGDTLIAFGKTSFAFNTYVSNDLGSSWTLVKSSPSGLGSNNFLFFGFDQVSIINSKTYFITCGQNNPKGVFKTIDGGVSFTQLPDPVNNFFPVYVNFSSPSVGVIAGEISSSGFGFYSTADAGQTWTPLYNSSATGFDSALSIPFLEIGNNTIIGQRRQHTVISIDGGVTFIDQSGDIAIRTTPNSQKIQILDNDNLVGYSAGGSTNNGSFEKKFSFSENGGGTWNDLLDSVGNVLTANSGTFKAVSSDTLFFGASKSIGRYIKGGSNSGRLVSKRTQFGTSGVMSILRKDNKILGFANGFAHISEDKGKTWRIINGATSTSDPIIDVEFDGFNSIYVLTNSDIFKSTDTTKTWTSVKQNMNLSTGATRGNKGITVIDSSIVLLFGNDGRLYKTTDGGQNWTDLKPALPSNIDFYDFSWMAFRTSLEGYAGEPTPNGSTYLLQTLNGGDTWSAFNQGGNMIGIIDMHFADSTIGACIGIFGPNVNRYYGKTNYTLDTVQAVKGNVSLIEGNIIKVSFYPNPAHNELYFYGTTIKSAKLFNLNGQQVGEWQNPGKEINISMITPGFYIIQFEDYNANMKTDKVLIH